MFYYLHDTVVFFLKSTPEYVLFIKKKIDTLWCNNFKSVA